MATRREKLLAAVFFTLLAAAGAWFAADAYGSRLASLSALIERYETQITRLRERNAASGDEELTVEELAERLSRVQAGFYAPGETDLYRFGLTMESLLSSGGIAVESCRNVQGAGAESLEYGLRADARAFAAFLKNLSSQEKYVRIESLSISSDQSTGHLKVSMRVGYEEHTVPNP